MFNKLFVLSIFLILCTGFVSGDPELVVVDNNNAVFNVDEDFNLSFQAVNSTGDVLSNGGYSCSVYVYDKFGGLVDSDSLIDVGAYDNVYVVSSDVFGVVGDYSFNVYCGGSVLNGGFVLSKSGLSNEDMFRNVLIYIIGLTTLIGILLYIVFNIDNKHIVLKFFIVSLAIYLPLTITRAIYLLEPNNIALDLIKYYLRIIYFFSAYIFMAFLWMIAEYYDKTIGIKRWFKEKVGRKGYE